jgi:hypothetical protein
MTGENACDSVGNTLVEGDVADVLAEVAAFQNG